MTHNPDQISSDSAWAAGRDAKLLDDVIAERDRLRELCAAYKGQVEAGAGEIARLRTGIQNFINGDYEPRVKKIDKCHHGRYGYEECGSCASEHFERLLKPHVSVGSGP